ncbi:hypothetical protein Pst134EA_032575 [Puccinia striiformis f. sp. tritici]|uniref:uncharacterized protein n=1 Tax=Puccinia striiformis f. sp. tritici TaxID=168172 RepID=UPI0020074022|nr:uncharacterized protein Pst134EA_032575 [Puccinia striiformis f. sp. tritici]KAH9443584.1 hypothetical protein Pst134EA_032575 [Puccinia striiformis f. sp. tritici]
MKITEAQGNIILTLDSKKATKYLLEVIQKSELNHHQSSSSELMISKDKEFYLGFLDDHQQNVNLFSLHKYTNHLDISLSIIFGGVRLEGS